MAQEPVVIPDKIYFKIGEVCELVGVQAHVLRYWETEFTVLSPQKNQSGQRSYRRRDVEIALRIKQLLYNEMFTIAGANKKLQSEHREGARQRNSQQTNSESGHTALSDAPTLFDVYGGETATKAADLSTSSGHSRTVDQRDALKVIASHLLELRDMLSSSRVS